jgi:hypothetical protein
MLSEKSKDKYKEDQVKSSSSPSSDSNSQDVKGSIEPDYDDDEKSDKPLEEEKQEHETGEITVF